jgi:hypothetical protein
VIIPGGGGGGGPPPTAIGGGGGPGGGALAMGAGDPPVLLVVAVPGPDGPVPEPTPGGVVDCVVHCSVEWEQIRAQQNCGARKEAGEGWTGVDTRIHILRHVTHSTAREGCSTG